MASSEHVWKEERLKIEDLIFFFFFNVLFFKNLYKFQLKILSYTSESLKKKKIKRKVSSRKEIRRIRSEVHEIQNKHNRETTNWKLVLWIH